MENMGTWCYSWDAVHSGLKNIHTHRQNGNIFRNTRPPKETGVMQFCNMRWGRGGGRGWGGRFSDKRGTCPNGHDPSILPKASNTENLLVLLINAIVASIMRLFVITLNILLP